MTNSKIIVDLLTLGTLTGDVFLSLQYIFQTYSADLGGTPTREIPMRSLQVLFDRGFVVQYTDCNDRPAGICPSDKAIAGLFLQNADGGRCNEPRDAFDCRLVADVPEWMEAPSAMGVAC